MAGAVFNSQTLHMFDIIKSIQKHCFQGSVETRRRLPFGSLPDPDILELISLLLEGFSILFSTKSLSWQYSSSARVGGWHHWTLRGRNIVREEGRACCAHVRAALPFPTPRATLPASPQHLNDTWMMASLLTGRSCKFVRPNWSQEHAHRVPADRCPCSRWELSGAD